jgi:N-acetyl-anhydromuramoyl-L-alanine amidase
MTPIVDVGTRVDSDGWLSGADRILSTNHDPRPAGQAIRLIVIHAISLPPGEFGGDAVTALFTNRLDPAAHPYFAAIADRRVSSHFFIRRDGQLMQFVSCRQRAWHAGISCWRGVERCNDFSLGIELEGDDRVDFTAVQYRVLKSLIASLYERFPIEAIVGHADIAPGRKTDPGPHFDWPQLATLRTTS